MSISLKPILFLPLFFAIACTIYSEPDELGEPHPFDSDAGEIWNDGGDLVPEDAGEVFTDDAGDVFWDDAGIVEDDGGVVDSDANQGSDCFTISQEAICVVTPQCQPLYAGVNCTCNDMNCQCDSWEFEICH